MGGIAGQDQSITPDEINKLVSDALDGGYSIDPVTTTIMTAKGKLLHALSREDIGLVRGAEERRRARAEPGDVVRFRPRERYLIPRGVSDPGI